MRICIVLPSLMGGGAEILYINLIKYWISKGHSLDLIVLTDLDDETSIRDRLPSECDVVEIGAKRIATSIFSLIKILFQKKYEIVLTAMWPATIVTVICSLPVIHKTKVFVSEHTIVSNYQNSFTSRKLYSITSYIFYNMINGIIAVSNAVRDDIVNATRIKEEKIEVIYNAVASGRSKPSKEQIEHYLKDLWKEDVKYKLLSVGSLKQEKDFITLINAFNLLPINIKDNCILIILGEGPERKNLESLIHQRGLDKQIFLPGFKLDPYPWYCTADLFVLSSKFEGFGNVIVEAMEVGLPIVSTNCTGGPSEILQEGVFGSLVPVNDPNKLSLSIQDMLNIKHDTNKLIKRAKDFSVSKIGDKYIKYFKAN